MTMNVMETKSIIFRNKIESEWNSLEWVRNRIERKLENYGKKIVDSSVMAASELIENAIKYGKPAGREKNIEIVVAVDKAGIKIVVSNPVKSSEEYEEVKRHIKRIEDSGDPGSLFVDRMLTLANDGNSDRKTMLGLIRIANEGGFELKCGFDNLILSIAATNDFAHNPGTGIEK